MANVSSNSDVLVVDMVGGLLTGAVAERLGGSGIICNSYLGQTPHPMDIVNTFNLSDEICKRSVRSSISDLLLPKESPQRNLVCLLHKMQPLATCMHNLQLEKRAIGLQITEPWLREYQVPVADPVFLSLLRVTQILSSIMVSFIGDFPFSFAEEDEGVAAASIFLGSASVDADFMIVYFCRVKLILIVEDHLAKELVVSIDLVTMKSH
ncbi:hypothetical protein RYX36_023055 [Vicia faba]